MHCLPNSLHRMHISHCMLELPDKLPRLGWSLRCEHMHISLCYVHNRINDLRFLHRPDLPQRDHLRFLHISVLELHQRNCLQLLHHGILLIGLGLHKMPFWMPRLHLGNIVLQLQQRVLLGRNCLHCLSRGRSLPYLRPVGRKGNLSYLRHDPVFQARRPSLQVRYGQDSQLCRRLRLSSKVITMDGYIVCNRICIIRCFDSEMLLADRFDTHVFY